MKALRAKIFDEDIIKRIVYTSVVETFRSSQRSFREFRHRARRAVTLGSVLPTVEADVQAYIVRNLDLYDSDSTVFEVVRHLNADPLLPNTVDYFLGWEHARAYPRPWEFFGFEILGF